MAILGKNKPEGKMMGIDWDENILNLLKIKIDFGDKERLILVNANFADIKNIVAERAFGKVDGIIFDLGFSSFHIEKSQAGFSFLRSEPLDMRYDRKGNRSTAADIVNGATDKELSRIFKDYGQERYAPRIAKAIVRSRRNKKISRSDQLVSIIESAVPPAYKSGRIHFATKTFQALRIMVNDELLNIESGVGGAFDVLAKGGKLAVISFHSLEDRIVKNLFRKFKQDKKAKILSKKPIIADDEEIRRNHRARSAKLRVLEKIDEY